MRKTAVGLVLLASAFSPLVAALALLLRPGQAWLSWALAAAALVPVGLLGLVLRALRGLQTTTLRSVQTRPRDQDLLTFLAAYVLPVVAALFADEPGTVVASLFLLVVLAVVYVRAGLYQLNPSLALLGYRLYEVTRDNGEAVMLLTREHHLPQRGEIRARRLADGVLVAVGSR